MRLQKAEKLLQVLKSYPHPSCEINQHLVNFLEVKEFAEKGRAESALVQTRARSLKKRREIRGHIRSTLGERPALTDRELVALVRAKYNRRPPSKPVVCEEVRVYRQNNNPLPTPV